MKLFDTIILGVLQGFTEFLPISSSGHLVIVQSFLGLKRIKTGSTPLQSYSTPWHCTGCCYRILSNNCKYFQRYIYIDLFEEC
jgi:hypothetical protein